MIRNSLLTVQERKGLCFRVPYMITSTAYDNYMVILQYQWVIMTEQGIRRSLTLGGNLPDLDGGGWTEVLVRRLSLISPTI